jgi:DNA-binding MarR family transcriptional regulator
MAQTVNEPETLRRSSHPYEEALLNLMRSADCLHRAFQHRLRPFGLTASQYNVLRILRGAQPGGLTCSAIGRSMITPEPDITRLLARLKAQKLLTQQRDAHDRRIVWTQISDAGLEVLEKLDGVVEPMPRELLGELNADEARTLNSLLKKTRSCADRSAATAGRSGSGIGSDAQEGHAAAQPSARPLSLQSLRPRPRPE